MLIINKNLEKKAPLLNLVIVGLENWTWNLQYFAVFPNCSRALSLFSFFFSFLQYFTVHYIVIFYSDKLKR